MTLISDPPVLHPFMGRDAAFLLDARTRSAATTRCWCGRLIPATAKPGATQNSPTTSMRLAGGLHARGIRPGDRVLVHFENCPETILARFACWWLGATAVLSNAHWMGPEIAPVVAVAWRARGHHPAEILFADRRTLSVARLDRGVVGPMPAKRPNRAPRPQSQRHLPRSMASRCRGARLTRWRRR